MKKSQKKFSLTALYARTSANIQVGKPIFSRPSLAFIWLYLCGCLYADQTKYLVVFSVYLGPLEYPNTLGTNWDLHLKTFPGNIDISVASTKQRSHGISEGEFISSFGRRKLFPKFHQDLRFAGLGFSFRI